MSQNSKTAKMVLERYYCMLNSRLALTRLAIINTLKILLYILNFRCRHLYLITACAVATSCCISYVPSQWEGRNFDPLQLPHFSTDVNETWNQERYPGYDHRCKICLMWDDGKGVCVGRAFSVTLCSILFCILAHAYRSHQKTDHGK